MDDVDVVELVDTTVVVVDVIEAEIVADWELDVAKVLLPDGVEASVPLMAVEFSVVVPNELVDVA